ncbi:MAG: NUDIX hydrolase [Terriglobia bacterium]
MTLRHTLTKRREIYQGCIVNLTVDEITTGNGIETIREVFHHPGGAAVVPVLPDGTVILVKQFRYPMQEILLELPAGKIDVGESPETTATRELQEETGFTAGRLMKISEFYSTPGFCDEKIHLYLAEDLVPCQAEGDRDEEIEIVCLPLPELLDMVKTAKITDAKTIIGLQYLALLRLTSRRSS